MRQLQRFYSLGCTPISSIQSSAFHHLGLKDFLRQVDTVLDSSRQFLCLFVIFSQIVLWEVSDCLGTSSVACAKRTTSHCLLC